MSHTECQFDILAVGLIAVALHGEKKIDQKEFNACLVESSL